MMPRQRETVRERGPRERTHPVVRVALRIAIASLVVLAGLLTVAFIDGNWRFAHLEAAAPARIYSAPSVLSEGLEVSKEDLAERLTRLGYRKVEGHPSTPGEILLRNL